MAEALAETTIAKPPDEVWARIGDFGDVSWVPNTASCRLEGDVRTIRMHGIDVDVIERLTSRDDAKRTYSFCLAGELNLEPIFGPGHVFRDDDLEATLTVTPKGDSESVVTWAVKAPDPMIEGTRAEYQAALESVKGELED